MLSSGGAQSQEPFEQFTVLARQLERALEDARAERAIAAVERAKVDAKLDAERRARQGGC